jgi:hypothetical protein
VAAKTDISVGVGLDHAARWMVTEVPFQLWNVRTGRAAQVPPGPVGAISPDGAHLAVADATSVGQVRLVDRANLHPMHVLSGPTAPIHA